MAVGQNFPHSQRPLGLSFQMAMMGAAGVLYPYLPDWLLSLYDINGVFLICSALFLHTIIAFIVFRYEIRMKQENNQTAKDDDKYKQKTKNAYMERNNNIVTDIVTRSTENQGCALGLLSARFCLFAAASAMVNSNASGFITVAQDIFTERTLTNSQILSSFMTFNICNSISRLGPAVSSKLKISCFAVSFLASVFGLFGQLLIMLSHSFIPAVVGSGLTGAALGSMSSTASTATFELFGSNRQAVGLGIMATMDGIAVTAIGPLFGRIRDTDGTYTSVLYLTISLNLVGFLLLMIILVLECRSTQIRLEIPRRNQTPPIASFLSQTTKY